MSAHNVYFSLKDTSDGAKKKLVAACKKHLSGHPGTVLFAAGVLAEECDRPVNDRDFDVALHVIFHDGDRDPWAEEQAGGLCRSLGPTDVRAEAGQEAAGVAGVFGLGPTPWR